MSNIIETKNLVKRYGSFIANDKISITIEEGSIYGLIGRNGAGKTTLMRMLLGLIEPTSGTITLFGKEGKEANAMRKNIGSIIETPAFNSKLTAYQNLVVQAKLLGIKNEKEAINEALTKVGLQNKKNIKVKNFSLGMRQNLGIAMAILNKPKLLILDEPINGLDPIAIANIREILLDMNKKGTTILISSHILGEMEKIATCYGFIIDGKLVKEISQEEVEKDKIDLEQLFVQMVGGKHD